MSDREMDKLQHEFEMGSIVKSPNVIEYLEISSCENGLAIVLGDHISPAEVKTSLVSPPAEMSVGPSAGISNTADAVAAGAGIIREREATAPSHPIEPPWSIRAVPIVSDRTGACCFLWRRSEDKPKPVHTALRR